MQKQLACQAGRYRTMSSQAMGKAENFGRWHAAWEHLIRSCLSTFFTECKGKWSQALSKCQLTPPQMPPSRAPIRNLEKLSSTLIILTSNVLCTAFLQGEMMPVFSEIQEPARTEAFLDSLQMLTGVALILFMWSHMVLVASINFGSAVMNAIARFLEDNHLVQTGGPVIVLIFLAHFVLAARKLPFKTREQANIWSHSMRLNHTDTWLWMVQAGTAMVILIMGSIHMWTVLTDLPITAAKSAARIHGGWWLAFYMVLLPLVELHVGIGFYRIGVKWGWITRSNRSRFKGLENRLTLAFIAVGAITLFTFFFIVEQ